LKRDNLRIRSVDLTSAQPLSLCMTGGWANSQCRPARVLLHASTLLFVTPSSKRQSKQMVPMAPPNLKINPPHPISRGPYFWSGVPKGRGRPPTQSTAAYVGADALTFLRSSTKATSEGTSTRVSLRSRCVTSWGLHLSLSRESLHVIRSDGYSTSPLRIRMPKDVNQPKL
jgi:hypothetical protein